MRRFSNAPVNALGFYLDDLFLGGVGDYDTVADLYKNNSDCQGQFWVENGYQYRFQTTADTNQCGTVHMQTVIFQFFFSKNSSKSVIDY